MGLDVLKNKHCLVLLLLVFLASCRQESTSPTDVYHGTWTGAISDRVAGAGTLTLVVPGIGLAGSFSIALASGVTLSGTTADYRILSGRLNIAFACPPGNGGVLVMELDNDRLEGTYAVANCSVLTDGTVDLGK